MSPEDTHKAIRIYIGGLILGVNTLYMLFCFFKLLAVVGNELRSVEVKAFYRTFKQTRVLTRLYQMSIDV